MIKPIHSRDLFKILKEYIDIPDNVMHMTLELSVDAPVVVSYTRHATPPVGKREELTNAD